MTAIRRIAAAVVVALLGATVTPASAQVSEKMRRTLMPMLSAVIWSDEVARIAMPAREKR